MATLRQLLWEARDLCGEAQELSLGDAEQIALQRKYGEVTAITRISFAFRGSTRAQNPQLAPASNFPGKDGDNG
jgi:hypothetical protein